ncbi:mannitol dehydrogenase family protein [Microbacterium sp. zg.Y909]|uniref:mannitol dehydrogenase family protein n=1 Tax=Microbacterium sp. zg.Y909 TaxID=2969413 RepID=UPI00214AB9DF|nr:mannitol dehydrogenase family protein [Microbacterium sp. zg.Y909]MCR2824844.1 mannitol dehydrogenase family protein [Microbacterium sp. zg.Y909]
MTLAAAAPLLTRGGLAGRGDRRPAPPPRIVHLGAGAFHRTHQAWFTARAHDADAWGIAAFTGRGPRVAEQLTAQDGLFTLVERGPDGDRFTVIDSVCEARPGAAHGRFIELMTAPETAVVTLTVTEAGYHLDARGDLDLHDSDVAADIAALRRGGAPTALRTPAGRLTDGLHRRHEAGAGPLAVVSCDNIPDNGGTLQRAVCALATACGWDATAWRVSFVATSVDRITPHTTEADLQLVTRATGWRDEAAVIAEPFADWVLSGDFPAGRPAWEDAGARFVDAVEPYEQRKLLMLNGGHLALAFRGLLRGHDTVAAAMADPVCRDALERFWDEAERTVHPAAEPAIYRAALVERFHNARIAHRLAQIAVDTATKLRVRVVPVIAAERAAGRDAAASLAIVADWATGIRTGAFGDGAVVEALADALLPGLHPADAALITGALAAPHDSKETPT